MYLLYDDVIELNNFPDEPNGGKDENCAEILNGGWNDVSCQALRPFICKVKGREEGDPIFPETTTEPPSKNCGPGWVEDPVGHHEIQEPVLWWKLCVNLCVNLCHPGLERSDWLFKLFQPIRMLQNGRSVNLCWKILIGMGPGFI